MPSRPSRFAAAAISALMAGVNRTRTAYVSDSPSFGGRPRFAPPYVARRSSATRSRSSAARREAGRPSSVAASFSSAAWFSVVFLLFGIVS